MRVPGESVNDVADQDRGSLVGREEDADELRAKGRLVRNVWGNSPQEIGALFAIKLGGLTVLLSLQLLKRSVDMLVEESMDSIHGVEPSSVAV